MEGHSETQNLRIGSCPCADAALLSRQSHGHSPVHLEGISYSDLKSNWFRMKAKVDAGMVQAKDLFDSRSVSHILDLPIETAETVLNCLLRFQTDSTAQDQALALYISAKVCSPQPEKLSKGNFVIDLRLFDCASPYEVWYDTIILSAAGQPVPGNVINLNPCKIFDDIKTNTHSNSVIGSGAENLFSTKVRLSQSGDIRANQSSICWA